MANNAPPRGAQKIAPTPPAVPAINSERHSRASNRRICPSHDPNPPPICAIGPSRPAEPPRADADRRGDGLDGRNPGADPPPVPVKGPDVRVRAVSFGFRGEGKDQRAGDQAPQRRDQGQQPIPPSFRRLQDIGLADQLRGNPCPSQDTDEKQVHSAEDQEIEEDRPQAGYHSHQGAEDHPSSGAQGLEVQSGTAGTKGKGRGRGKGF